MSTPHITPEEFNTFANNDTRLMLSNAYRAISYANAWTWLRNFDQESFMFTKDPMIGIITENMIKLGFNDHSGFSFAWTMRQMEILAKNGKKEFLNKFNSVNNYN
jgi:hypothetical protein